MTTIRTTCPRCGEVDMGPESILLSVDRFGEEGIYSFVCPVCMEDVQKEADRKIVALLVSAGVSMAQAEAAVALADRPVSGSTPDAPPLTLDDLIQFHYLLQDDQAIAELLSE